MNNKNDNNEKELTSLIKEQLGLVNPSPDQLKNALKELSSRKIISKFSIKSEKE